MSVTVAPLANSVQETVSKGQHSAQTQKASNTDVQGNHDSSKNHADQVKLDKAINEMNGRLKPQTEIVFDYDKVSQRIWLNVIDKASGKVIAELPPEVIRKIQDGYASHTGLIFDKKL